MKKALLISLAAGAALTASAQAQIFPEVEPNDSRATANAVVGMSAPGNGGAFNAISGNSIASSGTGIDSFLITAHPLPLGIYRNRLVISTTGTAGHTGSIRGLSQTAAPPDTLPGIPWDGVVGSATTTDVAMQSSVTTTTPARFNQWYGFGKGEQFQYRVTGTASTTADYLVSMETVPVTPVDLGTFEAGLITMNWNGQGHTTDTDMWVYDGNFDAIAGYGNDDSSFALNGAPIATTSLQSFLARNYAPGTYYIAVSNFQLAHNQASPSDDNFRTGTLLDFPNIIANSSATANLNMAFAIQDSVMAAPLAVATTKAAAFDVNWFKFTVVPTPSSMALLGLGGLIAARRRR